MRPAARRVVVASALGIALTTPVATTRAAWNDVATVSGPVTTSMRVAPVMSCQVNGQNNAVISWSQPATGGTFAPVAYTVTATRNGIATAVTVASNGPNRSVTVTGRIGLGNVTTVVTVAASLPGTSWTGQSSASTLMTGLLSGWEMTCVPPT